MLPDAILRLPAVDASTGLGRSTIYESIAAGTFLKPIVLGNHAVCWLASEVDAWIQKCISDARCALPTVSSR